MKLIGLTGPHAGGKLAVAQRLAQRHNFAHLRFDDPVRDMLASLLQIGRERIDHLLLDPGWRETPLPETGVSPRQLLASLSRDWGRLLHRDLWITFLRSRLAFIADELPYEYEGVVISDVRFENEARFIRDLGVLVHIARPELAPRVPLAADTVKFHSRDQILLNLGADFLDRHTDHLVRSLHTQRVA